MTDEELIARLRSMHWCVTTEQNGVGRCDREVAPAAADRIEALVKERDDLMMDRYDARFEIAVIRARAEQLAATCERLEAEGR